MKKLSLFMCSVVAALSLSACATQETDDDNTTDQTEQTTEPKDNNTQNGTNDGTETGVQNNNDSAAQIEYVDGTYTSQAITWDHGAEEVEITVQNGDVVSVILRRLSVDDEGNPGSEVDYNKYAGQVVDERKYPNLKQFRLDMAAEFILKQSTEDVDYIVGATTTTSHWITGMEDVLSQAQK